MFVRARGKGLWLAVVASTGIALLVAACGGDAPTATPQKSTSDAAMEKFPDQQFAAHFVDSNPKHASSLGQVPEEIAINFNFTLNTETSKIEVTKDGGPVAAGPVKFASNRLAMSAPVPATSGNGPYTVRYKACWPDKSCHDGLFAFKVAGAMMGSDTMGKPGDTMPKPGDAMGDKMGDAMMVTTPHFVDSSPTNGETFSQVPNQVVINFDFTLSPASTIAVTKDGAAVAAGKATLGPRNLALMSTLPANAGEGTYEVAFKACWPDNSCHDGKLSFKVDGKFRAAFADMTGKSELTIRMKDIKFSPALIRVSKGTKVTWVNDDPVEHFVNTDPHPSHNFLLGLNSLDLQPKQSFSYTFVEAGEFPYHCSLHVPADMRGRIIVG